MTLKVGTIRQLVSELISEVEVLHETIDEIRMDDKGNEEDIKYKDIRPYIEPASKALVDSMVIERKLRTLFFKLIDESTEDERNEDGPA